MEKQSNRIRSNSQVAEITGSWYRWDTENPEIICGLEDRNYALFHYIFSEWLSTVTLSHRFFRMVWQVQTALFSSLKAADMVTQQQSFSQQVSFLDVLLYK